jgi:hypothetical protein
VDNIKMGLKEIGWQDVDWICVAQGSGQGLVAGFCEHGNEPSVYIKGG